ncbi:hypothetical protein [Alkalicoccobacillus gibsonii]|uniref:hypothetical protein n=1 Tax=Alkalicoccobacillus gibsonii TaxID=79881 RepID=UPI0019338ABB|nr:hypothetical protein [Alkalicoccobacillus gibsonii]MBM0065590.1 hypothetical protein [Alkalicoccobacillus gibsonii]
MNTIIFILSILVFLVLLFIVIEKAVQRGIDSSSVGRTIQKKLDDTDRKDKR